MWGYDEDNEDNSRWSYKANSEKIVKIKKEIRELTSNGWPSKKDQEQIDKLEKEIESIRAGCSHDWEIKALAQYKRKYCIRCDKEDYTYDPRKG